MMSLETSDVSGEKRCENIDSIVSDIFVFNVDVLDVFVFNAINVDPSDVFVFNAVNVDVSGVFVLNAVNVFTSLSPANIPCF
jgi:hypothetical protein